MTTRPVLLAVLCLALCGLGSAQKLFRCFYYFEKSFVSFNLKDLYLDGKPIEHDTTYDGQAGKLLINICDGITNPDTCSEDTSKTCLFHSFAILRWLAKNS